MSSWFSEVTNILDQILLPKVNDKKDQKEYVITTQKITSHLAVKEEAKSISCVWWVGTAMTKV